VNSGSGSRLVVDSKEQPHCLLPIHLASDRSGLEDVSKHSKMQWCIIMVLI
jgi:hypothetical protein